MPILRTFARKLFGVLSLAVGAFMALFTYFMWWCATAPVSDGPATLGWLMVVLCAICTVAYLMVATHLFTTPAIGRR